MELTATERKIKILAGVLGIIVGTAWAAMALMCIVLYLTWPDFVTVPANPLDSVGFQIYVFFIDRTLGIAFPGQTLRSAVFHGFMWVHLLVHFAWASVSIYVLRTNQTRFLDYWSGLSVFLYLWDFITFLIAGIDLGKCLDVGLVDKICKNAILPVFLIAAKGFALWLIIIGLGALLFRMSRRLKRKVEMAHEVYQIS